MKGLIPSGSAIVKGFIITVVSLVILRFIPANIKAKILGPMA